MTGRAFCLAVALAVFAGGCAANRTNPSSAPPAAAKAAPTTTVAAPTTAIPPETAPPLSPTSPPTAAPVVPEPTAAAIAGQLAQIETAIRDPATPAAEADRLGVQQEVLYRSLSGSDPAKTSAVVALVPAPVRSAVASNARAVRELAAIPVKLKDSPPAWRIVAPLPATELLTDYKDAGSAEGVPWSVLAAIHLVETRLGRIRGTSTAGAQGPMQFLPSTWSRYGAGGDIESTVDSLHAAGRLLRANGAPANLDAALFAYNHSPHYVAAVRAIASVLDADERAFLGYHGWKVIYRTTHGEVVLEEGYGS